MFVCMSKSVLCLNGLLVQLCVKQKLIFPVVDEEFTWPYII